MARRANGMAFRSNSGFRCLVRGGGGGGAVVHNLNSHVSPISPSPNSWCDSAWTSRYPSRS